MTEPQSREPEKISSEDVIERGSVANSDEMKVKWALALSGIALLIGTIFLIVSLFVHDEELRTWATGLISLVVGAALGYAFSGNKT